jgi:tetratricopeptide (TPR) repeat protein
LRKKKGTLGKLLGGSKQKAFQRMSLVEQHSDLVYAESLLLKCVLGIFYAGDTIAFVKQALGLRSAYFTMRELLEFVEYCDGEAEEAQIAGRRANFTVDQDFRSGVYLGNGLCSLVLSLLPKQALKVMEGFGFVGDRKFSLDMFARAGGWSKSKPLPTISAEEEGVRRPLCDIAILVYHLVISAYVPVTDVDFEYADKILSWDLIRYPNGIFFLYFSARLYAAQALPEKAIEYYRNAIESQREYKQLHHMCFWDLSITYLSTCDYGRAHECYDVLSRESNWSKAIYQYAKAVMLYETGMDDRAKSAVVMRTVSKLIKKVAGRQIPFERFAVLKSKKYISNGNKLPLPGLEFSYLWHCIGQMPIFLLVEQTLTRIDEFIDELESYHDPKTYPGGETEYYGAYCISYFLRGTALSHVAYPPPHTLVRLPTDDSIGALSDVEQDAIGSFTKVFKWASKVDEVDRYVCYFAHYEYGRLLAAMNKGDQAKLEFQKVLSGKPLEAKGKGGLTGSAKASYLLSNMCQVRSHAAIETLRIQGNRSSSFYGSESGTSVAGSSIGGSLSSRSASMSSSASRQSLTSASSRSAKSSRTSASSHKGRPAAISPPIDNGASLGRQSSKMSKSSSRRSVGQVPAAVGGETTDYGGSRRR